MLTFFTKQSKSFWIAFIQHNETIIDDSKIPLIQIPSFMLEHAHNTFNYIMATNYDLSLSLYDNQLCKLCFYTLCACFNIKGCYLDEWDPQIIHDCFIMQNICYPNNCFLVINAHIKWLINCNKMYIVKQYIHVGIDIWLLFQNL